jgi:hypothetical protein
VAEIAGEGYDSPSAIHLVLVQQQLPCAVLRTVIHTYDFVVRRAKTRGGPKPLKQFGEDRFLVIARNDDG